MSKRRNLQSDSGSIDSTDTPTTDEVRQRLEARLRAAMRDKENLTLGAPTSSGKTYAVATTPWRKYPGITGEEPVIHFGPTKDARKSAAEKNNNSEATGKTLLGRKDACPVAGGDYDDMDAPDGIAPSVWFKRMCSDRGIPLSVAHDQFKRYHDGDIPCSPCESTLQWNDVPRTEEGKLAYDVIFATHQLARVPALLKNCNVVIDELPDFTKNIEVGDIRKSITNYLQHVDAPVDTYEDLITDHIEGLKNRFFRHTFSRPDTNWFLNAEDAHVLVPGIVDAILKAREECHDRWVGETVFRYPDLNPYADSPEYRVKIRIVFDSDYNINILQVLPDFTEARSVIGLDAHPTKPKWKANTVENLDFDRVLTPSEEQLWRRNERDLEIVQVGSNKYSWTNGGLSEQKVTGLCSEIRHQYGEDFRSGITSKQSSAALRDSMEAAGVESSEVIHYGIEKSVETFADESVGLAAGCISPSSDHIKDWLALLRKEATPKREVREEYRGQEWVGPDSSTAREILEDVREKHVLQAVGRYARSPADPEDEATVFVLTNVLQEPWVDKRVNDVVVLKEKQQEIVTVLNNSNKEITPAEISDRVEASRRHVYDTLETLTQTSWVQVNETESSNSGNLYSAERNANCIVELL